MTAPTRAQIEALIAAYDKANPFRTADWHNDGCDCLRCHVDRLRALTPAEPQPAPVEPVAWRTGLKDKAGREICLGDHLRLLNNKPHVKPEYWLPEYEVVWTAPSFHLRHIGGGRGSDPSFAFRNYPNEFETIFVAPRAAKNTQPEDADEGGAEVDEQMMARAHERARSAIRNAQVAAQPTPPEDVHPDDLAVDRFAVAMKAKLSRKRTEGRGGWHEPQVPREYLSRLLREHVDKGDPLDVGNIAMMLHQRGEQITPPEDVMSVEWEPIDFWHAGDHGDNIRQEADGTWSRKTTPPRAAQIPRHLPEDVGALIAAAHGLSFGEDWNNGTQAKTHGHRDRLLTAIAKIMGDRASPQAQRAALAKQGGAAK